MYRRFRVLLVEDNPADVRLLQEAFNDSPEPYELHTVIDGEAAMDFVHRRNTSLGQILCCWTSTYPNATAMMCFRR
jgi:CheY-like chemotaxis protein